VVERGTGQRIGRPGRRVGHPDVGETLVPRGTSVAEPTEPAPPAAQRAPSSLPSLIRLRVEDVTPAAAAAPDEPPPEPVPLEERDPDDVPLYLGLARGIDWIIGATMGDHYSAPEPRVDKVGEAIAPLGRRVAGLVGASGVVDESVPPLVRELATLAAAVYVAWGDAFIELTQEAIARIRAEREEDDDDGDPERRPARGDQRRARGRDRGPRRPREPAAGVGQTAPDPADDGVRPPGPGEGRGSELGRAFAFGSALGSGAG